MDGAEARIMEEGQKPGAVRHRIEIKLSQDQKELIVSAAAMENVGVSEFVRSASEQAARKVLSEKR